MKNTTDTLREQLRASYKFESAGFTCLGTCLFEVLLMGISLQEIWWIPMGSSGERCTSSFLLWCVDAIGNVSHRPFGRGFVVGLIMLGRWWNPMP